MKKKLTLFVILTLFISALIFALPKEDAEYLYLHKTYRINPDGSWILKYESKVKLNTYLSTRRLFGETFIVYNPKYQKLAVLKSETTMANGKKVPTPENGYNKVLPRAAHNFPDFSFMREMVISHTGLERGATEELIYTIKTKKDFAPYFFTLEPLKERVPVKELVISFEVPKGKELYYEAINSEFKPIIKENGDYRVFTFEIKSPKKSEPYNFYYPEDNPFLFVKVEKSGELKKIFSEEPLSESLKKKIEKIKENSANFYEFLLKIQKYVSSDIQTVSLKLSELGFHFRTINKVISSNYGTRIEKTKLLYSILKNSGLNPEVLIFTPFSNFRAITPLDKIFVKVEENGKEYFLNPVKLQSEFYPYGFDRWNIFKITGETFKIAKVKGTKDNLLEIVGTINLDNGNTGNFKINAKGVFNNYRASLKNELSFASSLLGKTLGIRANKIKKIIVKSPENFVAEVCMKSKVFKENYGKYLFFERPNLPFFSELSPYLFSGSRTIHFETPFIIEYKLKFIIPKNYKLDYSVKDISISNSVGKFTRKISVSGDSVSLKMKLRINKPKILKKELLRKIYENYVKDKYYLIFVKFHL